MLGLTLDDLILLGDHRLYEKCVPVEQGDPEIDFIQRSLHNVLFQFRKKYNAGRAIAAPQLGFMKQVVYMNIGEPILMINPQLSNFSSEMITLWDDCMSFPNLLIKLKRHKSCSLSFLDRSWNEHKWEVEDALSELIQHEVDHLHGILAITHALDNQSFQWRK